jgi:hypothetical protein
MEFIERIFGVSPDTGSGLFEALLFVAPIVLLLSFRTHPRSFRRLGEWFCKR